MARVSAYFKMEVKYPAGYLKKNPEADGSVTKS